MALTENKIRSATPKPKPFKLHDSYGLFLEVRPTGAKFFRVAYRFEGRQKTKTVGPYPATSLADARRAMRFVRGKIDHGEDPGLSTRVGKEMAPAEPETRMLWRTVAEEFIAKRKQESIARSTLSKLEHNLRRTYPALGDRAIDTLEGPDLLEVIQPFERAGKYDTAKDVRRKMSQVFQFAVATGRCKYDPAYLVKAAMVRHKSKKRPGLIDPREVGALMRAIRTHPCEPQTKAGLMLSALCALRSTELRGAAWSEIDFEARLWTIPGDRMKKDYGRHVVPLSDQALEVLMRLREWTGSGSLVFPAIREPSRWLSDATLRAALQRMGYCTATQHTQHGFRTTFSTNLNEMGWNRDWIEKQLGHHDKDDIRLAYNAAMYIDGRTQMMQAWGDWLEKHEREGYQ